MKLSLVTGTVNRPEPFANLVRSIVEHTTVDWELVVSDASDVPVECSDPRVRILPERPRLGCVKGYNKAFREARGAWIIFLNDDAEVTAGYDTAAIEFMEAHPQIGLGCLHYSENGGPFHFNSAWGVPYPNFGIFSKTLGEQVGYFDDALIMYGNDNSLALRILLADRGIADIPGSRILHHSRQDEVRAENQKHRARDNAVLHDTYMPSRRYWLAAYRKYRLPGQAEPWPHGQEPGEPSMEVKEYLRAVGIKGV